ncbi:MAG TPA: hypothetical protein ENI22_01985 [Candidatus Pacearchaeota archaeon]|nr:hypothetical protein [Candidatus Pacearchaeota archaeon]
MVTTPNTKPLIFKGLGVLEGDFGKDFLEEYNRRVKVAYNDNSALNVLGMRPGYFKADVVRGSNPFAVVFANQILRQERFRVATPADAEKAFKFGDPTLREAYIDTGLVLRSKDDPNGYLAKDLMSQIEKITGKKVEMPAMIPLNGLELRTDQNSYYGLAFNFTDSSEIIHDSILNKPGNFSSEDINPKTGLPKKIGDKGNRIFHTRDSGLSRLVLRNLELFSNWEILESSGYGRVVVVSDEAT